MLKNLSHYVSLELHLNRRVGVFQAERGEKVTWEHRGRAWRFMGSEDGLGGLDVGGAELVRRDKCAAEESVRTYCFVVGGTDCRILSWGAS